MNALLKRQLKHLGLAEDGPPPDAATWRALLARVDATYAQADQDRYTLERSLQISSTEMAELYADLERSSQTQLGVERDKLASTVATLRATVEASDDGVLVLDEHGAIVLFNRRWLAMWGIAPQVIESATGEELCRFGLSRVTDAPALLALVERLHEEETPSSRDEIVLADGRVIECSSHAVLLPSGSAHGRVWFTRDITDAKRAEQLMCEAKNAAEKASRIKSGFLCNMSHEMRTPLNSILGFARVLDGGRFGPITPRQREYLSYILGAGNHMLALVNDLLDLRRLEEDRAAIASTRVEIGSVVGEAIELVKALADDKRQVVTVEAPSSVPPVLADRRAVVQILVNLLSNAVKFTPAAGSIAVRVGATPDAITLAVADTGIGIHADDLPKLFTYFEQLGAKHDYHMQGSGIGLALTRSLVEKLGGHIHVASAPGAGSTFEFSIPRWTEA